MLPNLVLIVFQGILNCCLILPMLCACLVVIQRRLNYYRELESWLLKGWEPVHCGALAVYATQVGIGGWYCLEADSHEYTEGAAAVALLSFPCSRKWINQLAIRNIRRCHQVAMVVLPLQQVVLLADLLTGIVGVVLAQQ